MNSIAAVSVEESVIQEFGTIVAEEEGIFRIETSSGIWQARAAASCLLRPLPGDLVLLALHSVGPAFILAVLEKAGATPAELRFAGDVSLHAKNGSFSVIAGDEVHLVAGQQIDIVSPGVRLHANDAEISLEKLSFWGEFLDCRLTSIRMLVTNLESIIERFRQKIKRSYRSIEESETVKADRFECSATSLLSLKGKYSIMTAQEDVKIDAERIHIG